MCFLGMKQHGQGLGGLSDTFDIRAVGNIPFSVGQARARAGTAASRKAAARVAGTVFSQRGTAASRKAAARIASTVFTKRSNKVKPVAHGREAGGVGVREIIEGSKRIADDPVGETVKAAADSTNTELAVVGTIISAASVTTAAVVVGVVVLLVVAAKNLG